MAGIEAALLTDPKPSPVVERVDVVIHGINGDYENKCEGYGMVDVVRMQCTKCWSEIRYELKDSCPSCGLIVIECNECGYCYSFGE